MTNTARFLEDEVVPVLRVEVRGGAAYIAGHFGTAFFINFGGIFLTARHVIENAKAAKAKYGGEIALNVKSLETPAKNLAVNIVEHEFAPAPYDVAIGRIHFSTRNGCRLDLPSTSDFGLTHWRDVATLGYPETALNATSDFFNIHLRAHKGYIQRLIPPGEMPLRKIAPRCFELSFPVPVGLSGAPLQLVKDNHLWLVGLCVGSIKSEIQDYESEEILENGTKETIKKVRTEIYGIAEDVGDLVHWKPKILGNISVLDASQCHKPI